MIDFGWIKLRGTIAWWIWGIAHIYFLIGLRNRLSVALSWLWIHARDQRAARLITQGSSKVTSKSRGLRGIAGWAKARQRRAHLSCRACEGGHACALPTLQIS